MANRMRTATIVESLDAERLKQLDEKRDALSSIHESNSALRRVKKEAYFQHIYHSVGIEGNTMTLAQTRSVLETRMAIGGKSIDEHNEILGLDAALKYINATLVNRYDLFAQLLRPMCKFSSVICLLLIWSIWMCIAGTISLRSMTFWRFIDACSATSIQSKAVNFGGHKCMWPRTFRPDPTT